MHKYIITTFCVISIGAASADELHFYDYSDLVNFKLNGDAVHLNPNSENVLRLTDDLYQSSSAFFTNSVSLNNQTSFSAAFEFQISDPQGIYDSDGQGADGLAFVIQSNSNSVGGFGGQLGYGGLQNSLAIEFDTWGHNWWDQGDGNHVGVNINGNMVSLETATINERMNNAAVWTAWIDYNGNNQSLEVRLSQEQTRPNSAIVTATIDLEDTLGTTNAYVGFTSGTGAAGGDHDIRRFLLNDDYQPISTIEVHEPKVLWLLGFAFIVILAFRHKTNWPT